MVMKKQLMATTLFLSLILVMTFSSAAITFISPSATGSTATGDYLFNITTALANVENCTFATTADGVFNVTVNDTASDTVFNVTFDTTSLTNAEDTTLTALCTNTSGSTETNTLVINVDNTAPTCAFLIDKDIVEFQDSLGILTTQSSTDTTDLTYAWTLFRGDGTTSVTSTDAAPTFSGSDFDQVDEFTISLVITDEASKSTACTNESIVVKGSNGNELATASVSTFIEDNKTIMIVGGAFILLLLIAVSAFFVINGSKK